MGVLEHDAQLRELGVQLAQVRQERRLGVQDAGVGRRRRGHLSVKVEHHADFLHGGKHGVISFVRFDPALRVGRHAARVRLDTCVIEKMRHEERTG